MALIGTHHQDIVNLKFRGKPPQILFVSGFNAIVPIPLCPQVWRKDLLGLTIKAKEFNGEILNRPGFGKGIKIIDKIPEFPLKLSLSHGLNNVKLAKGLVYTHIHGKTVGQKSIHNQGDDTG